MLKIDPPKAPKKLPSKIMTVKETEKVLSQIPLDESKPFQFRDRVILEVMYSCSLRRSEIATLQLEDFNPETRSLRIKGSASKTKVGRVVPIGPKASSLLVQFIQNVRNQDIDSNFIFLNYKGNPVSTQLISKLARRVREESEIKTQATSHSFRKSSATHMLRNGARLETVQALLGHVDISATQVYTKIYPRDIIKMHKGFHPREREKNLAFPRLTSC
jgi:integrase/recombinase XerD